MTLKIFFVFPHFTHHPRALLELHRIVKPNGYLYILHLEGSALLNRFHSGLDGPVRHDRLPEASKMKTLLKECDWTVQTLRDSDHEYYVKAQK